MGIEKGTPVLAAAVDNDRMALLALKGILPQLLPSAQWLWGVGNADEAVAKALNPETRPRLLLVDMSLDEATGVSVCRKIRMRTDRVMLLGITAFSVDTFAERLAAAGAQGIVSKADIPQLAKALRTVAAGGTFVPNSVASVTFRTAADAHRLLLDNGTTASIGNGMANAGAEDAGHRAAKLGAKESETLHLLSRGLTYDQIAAQWGVAASTVRTHAHRAVDKLGAHSLAHAIALWLNQ
ncbi:response regulator transcription factor [Bifidobacterium miconisargentati]|uniref:response regulator transcription factor n=1 Tax=Bifidobacterium miconisargentati TaxID=2834437 RepID=UPI001BDD6DB6|nr:response regulator transcription factor [Bifidobacterium miconisargentati]MBW3090511.1 response regulator transcription factor [Bifidobacterium miconisargentati]